MKFFLLGLALVLAPGCYEAIEHQAVDAAGGCTGNDQCPCNEQCLSHACIPYVPSPCVHSTECSGGLVCVQTHRLGHNCGNFECQLSPDAH